MTSRTRRSLLSLAIAAVAIACAAAPPAVGQTLAQPTAAGAVNSGKATYQEHCAVCHGDHGKGDGVAAKGMTPRPTDLTTLSRRHGASLASVVEASVNGTHPAVAQGRPAMKVWRALFLANANGDEAKASAIVRYLVKFVESIQVK